ncbi:MAG TPA: tetratricopeptide repeat protein [Terriglobia bacterium]|nr:tetratricopeptide repeat protein [Terriglobia bacterium]
MAFKKAKALEEAHKYVVQGKNALAIQQYLTILENDPSDLILLNTIGDLYIRDKNVAEGLKQFYKLANAYVQEGFAVRAIAIYKKISKIDRNTAEPSLKLAELYQTQGFAREAREQLMSAIEFYKRTDRKDNALKALRKLARMDADNPHLLLRLAQYAEDAGEQKEAAEAYLKAAKAAQRQGDASTAEHALNKAAELLPGDPEVQLSRAYHAFSKQQPEQVEKILASLPELQNDSRAQQLLFESYLASHNLDAAEKALPALFHKNPSDFSPFSSFAAQCLAEQNYDRAFQAVNSVAADLIEQKKTGPLMEVLRKIWTAAPEKIDNLELIYNISEKTGDEVTIPEILEAMGQAYVQAGELGKAEQSYARLVVREPSNEGNKDLLKQVLQKQCKEYAPADFSSLSGADLALEPESSPILIPETESPSHIEMAPEQSSIPEEIDLTESAGQPAAFEDEALPEPQELPIEFETRQDTLQAPEGDPAAADGTESKAETSSPVEKAKKEIPPFNYQESREEIEFYVAQGFQEEAQQAVQDLEEKYPEQQEVATLRRLVDESVQKREQESPVGPGNGLQVSIEATEDQGAMVDLAGELASTLGDLKAPESSQVASGPAADPRPPVETPGGVAAELSSLLDDLQETKGSEGDSDDPETHYNLGVAFREMGLFDEAIGEFQKVVKGATSDSFPPNFLQGCTLLATCFIDKGMPAIAAKWYARAIEIPTLDEDALLSLRYDLGAAYEQAGDYKTALEKYTEVYSQNIDYRDVAEKIRILQQRVS